MNTASVQRRVELEQALAFGRSPEWMRDHYGATAEDIAEIRARLEKVNAETDDAQPGRPKTAEKKKRKPRPTAGQKALLEAARIESARIYGNVQREHSSTRGAAAVDDVPRKAVQRKSPDGARVIELRRAYFERIEAS